MTTYKVIHTHKYGEDMYLFKTNEVILNKDGTYSEKLQKRVIDLFGIDFTPNEYLYEDLDITKVEKILTLPPLTLKPLKQKQSHGKK